MAAGKNSVLVSGASSGIGRACAERLAEEGYRVFAGARLESDAENIGGHGGPGVIPVQLDITDAASIAGARERIEAQLAEGELCGLVNNAGIGVPGPLEVLDIDAFREQLEVNVTGQLALSQAMLPLLRQSRGRIVFVGSMAGKAVFPHTGAYSASKHAIEAVADALRQELREAGVGVSLIEPGPIDTPIWGKAAERARAVASGLRGEARSDYRQPLDDLAERFEGLPEKSDPPEKVADAVLDALSSDRPHSRYPVGTAAKILYRVRPLIPDRVFDAVTARV